LESKLSVLDKKYIEASQEKWLCFIKS
jgi:hypothetical protein